MAPLIAADLRAFHAPGRRRVGRVSCTIVNSPPPRAARRLSRGITLALLVGGVVALWSATAPPDVAPARLRTGSVDAPAEAPRAPDAPPPLLAAGGRAPDAASRAGVPRPWRRAWWNPSPLPLSPPRPLRPPPVQPFLAIAPSAFVDCISRRRPRAARARATSSGPRACSASATSPGWAGRASSASRASIPRRASLRDPSEPETPAATALQGLVVRGRCAGLRRGGPRLLELLREERAVRPSRAADRAPRHRRRRVDLRPSRSTRSTSGPTARSS
jgi:hypothetical protein